MFAFFAFRSRGYGILTFLRRRTRRLDQSSHGSSIILSLADEEVSVHPDRCRRGEEDRCRWCRGASGLYEAESKLPGI
uniref:Secreted protein n=1 Tax=Panagrellus redivivus TaxID=6233 RepID=A0A7E4V8S8_PANRE